MTPAVRALEAAGVAFELHSYEHDPEAEEYGMEAAEKLGLPAAQVFKTLLVHVHGARPEETVAMIPVDRRLDLKAVAAARQGKKAEMLDVATAQRLTGYLVGGISPLGQKKRLPAVLDASAEGLERIYVSAGRRGLDVELSPADLVSLTGASLAEIAR